MKKFFYNRNDDARCLSQVGAEVGGRAGHSEELAV
jgi:hypothetical protein